MVSLTENEARTLDFLIRNFAADYSINRLARELKISPGGMLKILRKLREREFLVEKKAGNNIFYKINFNSSDALDACKFALAEKTLTPYVRVWIKDLEPVTEQAQIAILFGSVLNKGRGAGDIDILLVFDKKSLKKIEEGIERLNRIKPKKVHAVYQTMNDIIENIKKKDEAIIEEIRTGIVLKGRGFLVEAIKHGKD